MNNSGIITLTTDFGLTDPYVGIMKGVILSVNPEARCVDISHQIKAGAITHAAALLQESYQFFPNGTIHVCVVDPGVGSARRPILIQTNDFFFVGPDNGLFWPIISAHEPARIIHLTKREYFLPHVSRTFHGRDIFSPVAAHLSRNIDPLKMGEIITDPMPLQLPGPQQTGEWLYGQIIRVDNFGNLITNIRRQDLAQFSETGRIVIKVGELIIEDLQETYADVKTGEVLALIGSSDQLEIAVNQGRANGRLKMDSESLIGIKVAVGRAN